MALKPVSLIITAVNKVAPVAKQVGQQLGAMAQQAAQASEKLKGMEVPKGLVESAAQLGLAFSAVKQAIDLAVASSQKLYSFLIGANERLREGVLQSAASIAATSRVFQDGMQVADPAKAIQALRKPLEEQLKLLQQDTLFLSGVTSEQVSGVFNSVLGQIGQINGQSKVFNDSLDSARSLTVGLTASLSVMKLDLSQSAQEVKDLLQGTITSDSQIAKNLGITNEQIKEWRSLGTVVDEVNKRLQPFIEANKMITDESPTAQLTNIQDTVEIIGREAGEKLTTKLTMLLKTVADWLTANRDVLKDFVKDVIENGTARITEVVKIVQEAIPKIQEAYQPIAEKMLPTLVDLSSMVVGGFTAMIEVAAKAAVALAPIVDFVAGLIAKTVQLIQTAQFGIGLITGSYDRSLEALDSYRNITNQLFSDAVNQQQDLKTALEAVNAARAAGKQPTEEQIKQAEQEIAQTDQQIDALKNYKAELETAMSVLTPGSEGRADAEKQIADIQGRIDALEALKTTAQETQKAVDPDNFDIKPPEAKNLGNYLEQVNKKLKDAQQALQNGTTTEAIDAAAKDLTGLIQEKLEFGAMSAEEAQRQLAEIRDNGKVSKDVQLAAQQAITKIIQESSKQQQQILDQQFAAGTLSRQDYNQKTLANTQASLDQELEQIQRQKKMITDTGSQAYKALEAQEKDIAQRRLDAQNKFFQDQISGIQQDQSEREQILEGSLSRGLMTEQEYYVKRRDLQLKSIDDQLKEIDAQRKKIDPKNKEALEALNAQESELYGQRMQTLKEFDDSQLQEMEQQQQKVSDEITIAQEERQAAIQQAINDGTMTEAQANQDRLAMERERIQSEIQLEQDKLAYLNSLPPYADPRLEEERQQKIRAARIATAQLTGQLAENERAQQEAAVAVLQEQLDRIVARVQNKTTAYTQSLEKQLQIQDAISRAMDQQNSLLEARKSLQDSIASVVQSDLSILKEMARTGKEGRELAQLEAQIKMRTLRTQQEYELQNLEIQKQQAEMARERERIELRIQRAKTQADIAQETANLAVLRQTPGATPEQIQAQQQVISALYDQMGAYTTQEELINRQETTDNRSFAMQEMGIRQRQRSERTQAQYEYIQTLPPGQRNRAMREFRDQMYRRYGAQAGDVDDLGRGVDRYMDSYDRQSAAMADLPEFSPSMSRQPRIDLPMAGNLPQSIDESQIMGKMLNSVDAIGDFLRGMNGLINVNQNNQIINQMSPADLANGNQRQQIEQQILNMQYNVAQKLKQRANQ